jgi:hypothetical protein
VCGGAVALTISHGELTSGQGTPSERGAAPGRLAGRARALVDRAVTVIVFKITQLGAEGFIGGTIAVIVESITALLAGVLIGEAIAVVVEAVTALKLRGERALPAA